MARSMHSDHQHAERRFSLPNFLAVGSALVTSSSRWPCSLQRKVGAMDERENRKNKNKTIPHSFQDIEEADDLPYHSAVVQPPICVIWPLLPSIPTSSLGWCSGLPLAGRRTRPMATTPHRSRPESPSLARAGISQRTESTAAESANVRSIYTATAAGWENRKAHLN
jgi:hypothetical protein